MDVVIVVATRKEYCGRKRPSTEARAVISMSFGAIFSFGRKSESSQKSADAPMALMEKSTDGEMLCEFAMSLQNIMLNPNIVYATATARWPKSLLLSIISFKQFSKF